MQSDGGAGEFRDAQLTVAGFDAVLTGRVDLAWVFEGWQGVQAERAGGSLTMFNFNDYGVPDYYTPVLTAHPDALHTNAEALRAFLRATSRATLSPPKTPLRLPSCFWRLRPPVRFPTPIWSATRSRWCRVRTLEPGRG